MYYLIIDKLNDLRLARDTPDYKSRGVHIKQAKSLNTPSQVIQTHNSTQFILLYNLYLKLIKW